jgi:hypothetical protein
MIACERPLIKVICQQCLNKVNTHKVHRNSTRNRVRSGSDKREREDEKTDYSGRLSHAEDMDQWHQKIKMIPRITKSKNDRRINAYNERKNTWMKEVEEMTESGQDISQSTASRGARTRDWKSEGKWIDEWGLDN